MAAVVTGDKLDTMYTGIVFSEKLENGSYVSTAWIKPGLLINDRFSGKSGLICRFRGSCDSFVRVSRHYSNQLLNKYNIYFKYSST